MANFCNVFLFTIGMSILGQVSYGFNLFGDSLDEGERQSCPNANCLGKAACTSDDQCYPNKCCIDLTHSMACCYQPGGPINTPAPPPTTKAPTQKPTTKKPTTQNPTTKKQTTQNVVTQNPTTNSLPTPNPINYEPPLCVDYYPNTADECTTDPGCTCTQQSDCYANEVCCFAITTDGTGGVTDTGLYCYLTEPTPTTTTTTTTPPGGKCPTTTQPLVCAPFHEEENCLVVQTGETSCLTNEICCVVNRGEPPCCVVYP